MTKEILVGTRKGLFKLSRTQAKGDWTISKPSFPGNPVTMVFPDTRDGIFYAALNLGHFGVKLHRSSNRGEAWEEISVPSYPPKPAEADGITAEESDKSPWSVIQIWALESGGPEGPGVLWAGTIPGGLFRSEDSGASWSLVRSLWDRPERREWFGGGYDHPGIHSICVDPRDSGHVTVGVSCGGVWTTQDGGGNWECRASGMWAAYMPPEKRDDPNIQDPHRLVQCIQTPDDFWVQHHNGVFRSRDGAHSWQEIKNIKPSVFGFAVCVHPSDSNTAWFVPATSDESRIPVDGQTVVTRTRDGGKSFQVLRNGLPQSDSYHLIYRHGMDIDSTGEKLVLGSTTGGLWYSDDQGESWKSISSNLPPIYCVRFAEI